MHESIISRELKSSFIISPSHCVLIYTINLIFILEENYEGGSSIWKENADVNPNCGTVVSEVLTASIK